jgi:phospholipase/carboxylesterase
MRGHGPSLAGRDPKFIARKTEIAVTYEPVARKQTVGDLDCIVVDSMPGLSHPQALMVLCHGFGAPGTDLVECCRAMWQLQPERLARVRFAFPAGPLSLDESGLYDARAWWPIDMERLNYLIATGQFRNLRFEKPELLEERRRQMCGLIDQLLSDAELDHRRLMLGGFSQGAMLTTDVALHLTEPPLGLLIWSGTLLNEAEWKPAADRQRKFRVFQSHGRQDPILPFAAAESLRKLLGDAGFQVDFCPFDGFHEIPMTAMRGAAQLAADLVALD